nr:MAG TPA: hypothetical protein [Bacteriophage sp.]
MKWTIDSEVLEKYNLSMNEFILLLFLARGGNVEKCIDSLLAKKWADKNIFNQDQVVLNLETKETVQTILLDSDTLVNGKQGDFESLANQLREIFPKGNKAGTNYNWRGSTAEIARKLKNLVVKYGCRFTEEEAIKATKAYVASFNGDYKYMKLLKYFLLKTPINNNGDVEIESDFMTYLENKGAAEENNGNWAIDLA